MDKSAERTLINFLGGYWHQDVESTESGLQDVFREHTVEQVRMLAELVEQFLSGPEDLDYKRNFVQCHADGIGFLDEDPLDWVQSILKQMRSYVAQKQTGAQN
jgi:hypothetical protein